LYNGDSSAYLENLAPSLFAAGSFDSGEFSVSYSSDGFDEE